MSFRVKISVLMTVLVAFLFSIGSSVVIHRAYMSSLDREEQEAVDSLQMVNSVFRLSYENNGGISESQLTMILRWLGSYKTSSDVFLLYKDKNLIYGSGYNKDIPINIDSINDSLSEDDGIAVNYLSEEGSLRYILSSYKMLIGNNVYIMCNARNIEHVTDLKDRLYSIFMKAYIVILVVTAILSWILSTILVRPLQDLTKATREISDGNLSYRSGIKSYDEVGELSRNFDKMADSQENSINLLKNTLEAKDRFMGAFTHEMKTPMTSLIGYAELLRTRELDPEDKDYALEYIYTESKRLESMSQKLLQIFVNDNDDIEMTKVDPAVLVEDVAGHQKVSLSKKNIELETHTESGEVYLEPDLIKTLLLNLIDNAAKAIEGRGNIKIEQSIQGNDVCFKVSDNGKGIPEENIKHLTEAFYRVDKSRSRAMGGAGLGLSIVAKIVELHHGTISFDSKLGDGTTVTVILKGGAAVEE